MEYTGKYAKELAKCEAAIGDRPCALPVGRKVNLWFETVTHGGFAFLGEDKEIEHLRALLDEFGVPQTEEEYQEFLKKYSEFRKFGISQVWNNLAALKAQGGMGKLQIIELSKENTCPACGEKSLEPVWVVGDGNNHYGKQCSGCGSVYVLYYNNNNNFFGLRPATLR
jgi:hypothetical protein